MRIAVYCSSRDDLPEEYQHEATEVGACVARTGATLIYGGLTLGMMGLTAKAAKAAGARVVGIVPVKRKDLINPINDENVLTLDLNDRKAKMELMSDIFVVLSGGYGTLDELVSTFSFLTFTSSTDKPIIVLNRNGLYDPILRQLRIMVDRGLMSPLISDRITVATDVKECCELITQFANMS